MFDPLHPLGTGFTSVCVLGSPVCVCAAPGLYNARQALYPLSLVGEEKIAASTRTVSDQAPAQQGSHCFGVLHWIYPNPQRW